jgi:CRISPR-associated endonuclease/helicase Cas3
MLEFWAKSGHPGDAALMHSVAHHSLDVAACAMHLAPRMRSPVSIDPAAIAALVTLHDVGKFTRTFQAKVEALWPTALGPYERIAGPSHDAAGFAMLCGPLAEAIGPLFPGWDGLGERWPLLRAVAGHHGRPPETLDGPLRPRVACRVCLTAACRFVEAALTVIAPPPLPVLDDRAIAALTWWLAGLTTLADWIGSSRRWFPPIESAAHADLAAYWHDTQGRAARAVAEAGLSVSASGDCGGMAGLFPGVEPRPLQEWAERVALPEGPALCVIEDATGAGKTEAALILAHRLLHAGRGQGVFFALPTMATANAMYERLAPVCERLFAPEATPSLVLAHGRRALNERFAASILAGAADPAEEKPGDAADQPAGGQCAAWIADDRRKAFLAEIGVGTVDQALMAVLPARHAMLRLIGLAQRVLIVDEAHAYDAYMTTELKRLLQFHAALGGSAIVLSATLTTRQRAELCAAFRAGLGALPEREADATMAYPLGIVASAAATVAEPIPAVSRRRVTVERVATPEDAARALDAAARQGAAVAWVRNTVDDAIAATEILRALGHDPLLFHARFAMGDRLDVEQRVLRRFGKTAAPEERQARVLVATQVVEQSLDLDFDLMVSDLAPADLVIQRAGRVWRHERGERPVTGPRLLLLAPEPVAEPAAGWLGEALRGTGAVYRDVAMLWRSARVLLGAGVIETPDNIRALVEEAFDRDRPSAEPAAFTRSTDEAIARALRDSGIARQNVLRFDEPYAREAGLWQPDIHTPTRLSDPQVTLRLARIEAGRLEPWCADDDRARAWALSEISVRQSLLAGPTPDPGEASVITAERAGWPAWERDFPVLVLRAGGEETWIGLAETANGQRRETIYSSNIGMRLVI